MHKLIALAAICAGTLSAQYKVEAAGAPPADAATLSSVLAKEGTKILKPDGSVLAEMWFRSSMPTGGRKEDNAAFEGIPHGALLGIVHFPARYSDRRGQTIKPGVYTMRYSLFPVNGDHQGVAPQRDFLVLSPAGEDKDGTATPAYDPLMDMSRKASGTPHPLVFSFWKSDAGTKPGMEASGEHDQVLNAIIGGVPVSIIVVGRAEG